ncbi:Type II secretory pathway, component PulK [Thalassovita gelatinovora]|uniref:Type II secretion system protein K n=1 Tax=Thalassovita gelatinovora TaxID=53501 RepID=A0A0P1F6M3_THAGE|nr:type II secretion system minor pseudopilin GspK [Thalassovita gelatinovora]QIZ80951.1 type II secretion system minor pseudopilin GspK [Thalassovita gelatinovora]CUH63480.1 Type II secretory pathway, component PulK [Thalassovita gelatinovora]SEQ67604.1 general secretion pathway protein K [Thalassovita gelatinovora]
MRDRGFILVNALVIVAALTAVAVFLLSRAETGRVRLLAGTEAEQLALNLDAYEAWAVTLLARDSDPVRDHLGEDWANAAADLPLARGRAAGKITDVQGLFNLNWLADPENRLARDAFDRLLTRIGVPLEAGAAIRDLLRPGGPENRDAYLRLDPPIDPVGGSLLRRDQLRGIPGLSPQAMSRLARYITAIPGDSRLNVNTAPEAILAAFLPDLPAAALNRIVAERDREPFASVEAFMTIVGLARAEDGQEDPDTAILSVDRVAIGSDWFRVDLAAQLNGRSAERETMLRRGPPPTRPEIVWRVSRRP